MTQEPSNPASTDQTPQPVSQWRAVLMGVIGLLLVATIYATAGTADRQSKLSPEMIQAGRAMWLDDMADATSRSRQTGRPILIYFTSDACPPCHRLSNEIFPQSEVIKQITSNFIPLRADGTHSPSKGLQLFNEYRLMYFPTLLVINEQGQVIGKKEGVLDQRDLQEWLAQNVSASATPAAGVLDDEYDTAAAAAAIGG